MKAAVFLDRDNTIIENDGDLGDPDQVVLFRGTASAIASLRGLGYCAVVVTNQGGVARGKYGEEDVQAVHRRINELIESTSNTRIDRFYYCPYHPTGIVEKYTREHPWRKPQPGMLQAAAEDLELDLSQSWMIGDQLRDIEAGRAAGVRTILLKPDAKSRPPLKVVGAGDSASSVEPEFTAKNLIEAVRIIAQQRRPEVHDETWEKHEEHAVDRIQQAGEKHDELKPAKADGARAVPIEKRPHRPFKPWGAASSEDDAETEQSGTQVVEVTAPEPVAVPAPPPEPEPVATPDPPKPAPEPEAAPAATMPDPGPPVTETVDVTTEPVLRQILQELRNSRNAASEFSYIRMFATVIQMVALVCLIGAFWMGGDELADIVRWMSTAVFLQLFVIAMLLFGR